MSKPISVPAHRLSPAGTASALIGIGIIATAGVVAATVSFFPSGSRDARVIQEACASARSQTRCIAEKTAELAHERGLEHALSTVQYLYTHSPPESSQCGDIAAYIGHSMYEAQPEFRTIPLPRESVLCNYGFIQAYAEELMATTRDPDYAREYCEYVEGQLGEFSEGGKIECMRGTGYGVVYAELSRRSGIEAVISAAIATCDRIGSTFDERKTCAGGVFNKASAALLSHTEGLEIDAKDPLGICLTQKEEYRGTCYGNFKYVLVRQVDSIPDMQDAVAYLEKQYAQIPDLEDTLSAVVWTRAYEEVIRAMPSPGLESIVQECDLMRDALRWKCLYGAALSLAKNAPPGRYDLVLTFCEAVRAMRPGEKFSCPGNVALDYLRRLYSADTYAKICAGLHAVESKSCLDTE